ncbi:hypothetical protein [Paraburkholderia sediminicola]
MDWSIIYVAIWEAYRIGCWITVPVIFAVDNRQRALSNHAS